MSEISEDRVTDWEPPRIMCPKHGDLVQAKFEIKNKLGHNYILCGECILQLFLENGVQRVQIQEGYKKQ